MSYDEWFHRTVSSWPRHAHEQRWGQWYYNCLPEHLSRQLCGTVLDPFYHDQVWAETEAFVRENWVEFY